MLLIPAIALVIFQALVNGQTSGEVQVDAKSLHLIKRTEPLYPPIARAAHVTGDVKIRVVIGLDGHVKSTTVQAGRRCLPVLLITAFGTGCLNPCWTPRASRNSQAR